LTGYIIYLLFAVVNNYFHDMFQQLTLKLLTSANFPRILSVTMENRYIAIAVQLLGSQSALARACGYSRSGICLALHGKRMITAELAVAIDQATGGEVSRAVLRPDLFRPARAALEPRLAPDAISPSI
jgi:DNA-binding transcriptional regulator YdaS (Cro superfamily)